MEFKKVLDIIAVIGAVQDIDEMRCVFLEMLRRLVWFDRAVFWITDHREMPACPPVTLDIAPRFIDHFLNRYTVDQTYNDAYLAYKSSRLLVARNTDYLVYPAWPQKSEYFRDILNPDHIYYQMGCDIKQGNRTYGILGLDRTKSSGNFTRDDMETLHLLYPHLLNRIRWYFIQSSGFRADETSPYFHHARLHLEPLTRRERDIVLLVQRGASNKEIAEELNISVNTVKMHLQNIFGKLNIKKRIHLYQLNTIRAGLWRDRIEVE